MSNIIAGKISFKIDGTIYPAKGSFKCNPGRDKKEMIVGSDGVHGAKSMPQVPFIEGKITDRAALDIEKLLDSDDVTATVELANGKVFALYGAVYAADGSLDTEEGEIDLRLEGLSGEWIKS